MEKRADYRCLFDCVSAVLCSEQGFAFDSERFDELDFNFIHEDTPFAHYFGPPNLGFVFRFCEKLSAQRLNSTKSILAVLPSFNLNLFSNKVFLLGAYMILQLGLDVPSVMSGLEPFLPIVEPYRNSPPGSGSFDLHIHDCWWGLFRAREVGWSDIDGFDIDEYEELNSSLNADLNQVVHPLHHT
jgi:hypothetical protein